MKLSRLATAAVCLLFFSGAGKAAPDDSFDGGSKKAASVQKIEVKPAPGRPADSDGRLWIVATAPSSAARTIIADAGVSIEEIKGSQVGGIASPRSAERLRKKGVAFASVPLAQRFRPQDFPPEDSAFHNYDRTVADLAGLASGAKGLASLFSIGQSRGDPEKGVKAKDIWALRLNTTESGTEKSSKPGIVFLGTHHAREHLSTEVPLLLAKYLIENRQKPEIASLLATRDIYIIPMVNPDGVEYDIEGGSYRMHRKNMRKNEDGSYGVDLNRNYGYHWGGGGASPDPGDETYRGPAAFSEPESQAVKAFVDARKDTLKVILTYHSFSELILYPWGHTEDPIADGKALSAYRAMAGAMARMTGYTPEQASSLYIASGDTTDWAWGTHRIFSFTFELTPKSMWGGGFYPGAGAIATTFASNLRPALYLIGLADDPYRAAENEPVLTRSRAMPQTTGGR